MITELRSRLRLRFMRMRLRFKILFACIALFAGIVLAILAYVHVTESPSAMLKRCLQISSLPASVANLQMGSDEWQDVTRCFVFRIAPADFPQLLAGRVFRTSTSPCAGEIGGSWTTSTLHIAPRRCVSGTSYLTWKSPPAECRVYPNDSHDEVIVIFSVQLTGT